MERRRLRRKKYVCLADGQIKDECITGLLKEEWIRRVLSGDYNEDIQHGGSMSIDVLYKEFSGLETPR